MKLRQKLKMYPPRVKMTVLMTNPNHVFNLPVKITGCSKDSWLDVDIIFPLTGNSNITKK